MKWQKKVGLITKIAPAPYAYNYTTIIKNVKSTNEKNSTNIRVLVLFFGNIKCVINSACFLEQKSWQYYILTQA